jgi:hypothetical protein
MSTRNIMWTALPNGLTADGKHLILSVLVSPRLVTDNGVDGTLKQFGDFIDWPKTVGGLRFKVEIQGGPSFAATPTVEPGNPALDSAAWKALFNGDSYVKSYAFDDRADAKVRSFPTKQVLSFIKNQYQAFAIKTPDQKPSLAELGLDPAGGGIGNFGEIAIISDEEESIRKRIDGVLDSYQAIPPGFGSPVTDFYQVQIMHDALSKQVRNPNGTLQPLPPQKPPEVDFHRVVGSLGQYQKLVRALGLAIDLEIPLKGVAPASNIRVTPSLDGPAPMTPWTAYQFDQAGKTFVAAARAQSDVSDGMLLFTGPDEYDVVEVDIDGAARKAQDFASNLTRVAFGEAPRSIDTPEQYGLPALRSGGFSAARVGRALKLVNTFKAAHANNAAITGNPKNANVVLHAEDVTRGYRVDVWDSLRNGWHSLHMRDGTYKFGKGGGVTRKLSDEGFTTSATTQSADGTTSDLRLPESLFRWAGWSLSVRRVGRTIGSDSTPQDVGNPASSDFKLETSFEVTKGTLPRLRFGALYQFRARAVDLAGNSLPPDVALSDAYNIPPQPVPYLRYEPVPAPVLVLRKPIDLATTPGESVERIVIRSNYNTHIAGVSERHIAPAKASHEMAETHGMLDTPAGPPDKSLYGMLVSKDAGFATDPAHPDRPVPHPEAQLKIPYLPDPFTPGAAFKSLPGTPAGFVWQQAFTGTWPDTLPFRLALDEGSGPPAFVESATERVLTVHLPKATIATVALSSYLTDDATSRPPNMLSTMKIWSWITEANPPNLSTLQALALQGSHWMLTPPRILTLVHAVQQPLIEPQFQDLEAGKVLGETAARISDEFPISGKSTIKVALDATWQEPVDDLSDNPQPQILDGAGTAFELHIDDPTTTIAVMAGRHEFHDTKHRNVTYTAVATTRFREYFPDAVTADPKNITRASLPETLSILSSARPPAPKVLYVIPAFRWETDPEGAWTFSRRSGGGLRVYLDRPWYASGEGELLGVVLWGCPPPDHAQFRVFEVPELLRSYVTQWGMDPIWDGYPTTSEAVPRQDAFLNAAKFGDGLSLDELSLHPNLSFSVAGHTVAYDAARKLWYCDIEMDPGGAYFPFVRLALARYQPESVDDAHLSRVILADFIQLMPGRSASITVDPIENTNLHLAIDGLTYNGPGQALMTATLQTQPLGGGDLAWVPVSVMALTPDNSTGLNTLWTADITLPAPRGTRPFRLLIEEFETFPTDFDGKGQQRRLTYADVLQI